MSTANGTVAALRVTGLRVNYGAVQAVAGIELSVAPGECVGLVGANGAGKTSTLHAIGGLINCGPGSEIELDGASLRRVAAPQRARMRLGHVLEGRHVFPDLTVAQNLELGNFSARPDRREAAMSTVLELLPELDEMRPRPAGALSGGQQQMLAIGRALAGDPHVLLLDEPTNGLAPILVERVVAVVNSVCARGIGALLVEQRLEVAQATAREIHVLQHGRIVHSAASDDPDLPSIVHNAYLS
ncbi:MAG TPA: ABC transporter ATP-binding protein [Solirubrobacterales bacterium]|nr:ABC transporter ATP-binding protein [Solirubrobacterales bacterium]